MESKYCNNSADSYLNLYKQKYSNKYLEVHTIVETVFNINVKYKSRMKLILMCQNKKNYDKSIMYLKCKRFRNVMGNLAQ